MVWEGVSLLDAWFTGSMRIVECFPLLGSWHWSEYAMSTLYHQVGFLCWSLPFALMLTIQSLTNTLLRWLDLNWIWKQCFLGTSISFMIAKGVLFFLFFLSFGRNQYHEILKYHQQSLRIMFLSSSA